MNRSTKIYVAGHKGLIGSAAVKLLENKGYRNLVVRERAELDLVQRGAVDAFFDREQPEVVILAAGRVGGIIENQTRGAEFLVENLAMQLNVFGAAHRTNVQRLVFFGSSCMYPRECPQPMREDALLSGKPEPTSLPYAIAKLAGVYACLAYNQQFGDKRFLPVIPNSTYGPNDDFDLRSAHVLAALIRRFAEASRSKAPSVTLWGTGTPRREFIHADDVADACVFLLDADLSVKDLPINIGTGTDYSILELAGIVAGVVGFRGRIEWDPTKPDGAPRKLLDSSRLRSLGWSGPKIGLAEGIRTTFDWFLSREREAISG